MKIIDKAFGATGHASAELTAAGLRFSVTDSEKASDQELDVTVKPVVLVESLEALLGGGRIVTAAGTFLIDELNALAAKP